MKINHRAHVFLLLALTLGLTSSSLWAVEDGLGTNVVSNLRVNDGGTLSLGGEPITNWTTMPVTTGGVSRIEYIAWSNSVQGATNALNTATNGLQIQVKSLQDTTNALNTATNGLQIQVKSLQDSTNALNTATNGLQIQVKTLQDSTNALNTATNGLQIQVKSLQDATNTLNTAVTNLIVRTNYWNNGVIIYEGSALTPPFVAGNLYCMTNGADTWTAANASTNTTAQGLIGLALGTTMADGLLLNGQYTKTAHNFPLGTTLYMSTNDYVITNIAPFRTNNVVRIVGYAIDADKIMFNPDRTYIEILGENP